MKRTSFAPGFSRPVRALLFATALAVTEAQLAVQLSYENPYALDTLASAYAEAGDFEKAEEADRKALAKIPGLAPERKEIEARLEGFGQRKPYRDIR